MVLGVALTVAHVLRESIEIDGSGAGSKDASQQLNRIMVSCWDKITMVGYLGRKECQKALEG